MEWGIRVGMLVVVLWGLVELMQGVDALVHIAEHVCEENEADHEDEEGSWR